MTPLQFVDKWRPVTLTERAAAQSHFLDLCRLFDHPTPIEADPKGEWFTFEKGVHKSGGGKGFADVWMRSCFAWEYKKKHRDLDAALGQLARYALALESPPLHIVCDTDRFRIVTAYTNSAPRSYDLSLEEMLDPKKRGWLEAAFRDPRKLKPGADRADLTKEAADRFSTLALRLQGKGHGTEDVGHFVNRLVFLFFAEDVGLLERGFFRKAVASLADRPAESKALLTGLFRTFKTGGRFGLDRLPHINGGLFDDREALPLDDHEVGLLTAAGSQDWAHIDPTIFGTLFERFLDPGKRAQIGAHYTDAGKIKQIIEPVILRPLREEWDAARADIQALVTKAKAKGNKSKDWQRAEERRSTFLERLRTLSILDPACGSGNFLYLALHGVKNLEHAANQECEAMGLPPLMPMVGPEILRGIEINPLAAELARATVWIGDIQWAAQNGIRSRPEPILRRLDTIECRDALLSYEPSHAAVGAAGAPVAVRAPWPDAEFIVGNPPFLGTKKIIGALGETYASSVREAYAGAISLFSDYVCWWFAKANDAIRKKMSTRVGLVATNSIRGGKNRLVLDGIVRDHAIFEAWSDESWINDGAAVRVSLICFSGEEPKACNLNGKEVPYINSDLTFSVGRSGFDITKAKRLKENAKVGYVGTVKAGSFDVTGDIARAWLQEPVNPNGRPNSDVIRPWINTLDLVRRPRDSWVVDFGEGRTKAEAALYTSPFKHVHKHVQPQRAIVRRERYRELWWQFAEPCSGMRKAIGQHSRYIATPTVSKHRVFTWVDARIQPDHQIVAIAKNDNAVFGCLHSRYHEQWALRLGTSLEDRPRYTPTTTFETFPFPEGIWKNTSTHQRGHNRIASCVETLDRLRQAWLNPADLVRIEPEVTPEYPDRILPKNASAAAKLKTRTLTALYNERPTWLDDIHHELDAAVAAAYGWPEDISTEDALAALLELNRERAAAQEPG